MRIFTVDYKSKIRLMKPKIIQNDVLGITMPQLRAVNEELLVNFIAPDNCGRIVICSDIFSSGEDVRTYMYDSYTGSRRIVANVVTDIHNAAEFLRNDSNLSIYEMDPADFNPMPDSNGFYCASHPCPTVKEYRVKNICRELYKRNAALTFVSDINEYLDHLRSSTMPFNTYKLNPSKSEFLAPNLRAF